MVEAGRHNRHRPYRTLLTEAYAHQYLQDKEKAIAPYIKAAETAQKVGLGINAGMTLT